MKSKAKLVQEDISKSQDSTILSHNYQKSSISWFTQIPLLQTLNSGKVIALTLRLRTLLLLGYIDHIPLEFYIILKEV